MMVLKKLSALILSCIVAAAQAKEPCPAGTSQLIVHHAGSLSAAFAEIEALYTKRSGVCVTDGAGGSIDVARKLTAGHVPGDIYASADFEVIDQMLKPAGFADYSILFAGGSMVLAYTTESKNAATIAAGSVFNPPDTVPDAAPDWYTQLNQPGVSVSGSHPFLDPGGYRADMIFKLAQAQYGVANLYNDLLGHYKIAGAPGGLGKLYDYQFTYEHSARAAAKADKTGNYRYVKLPDAVSLGIQALNNTYGGQAITVPGLQVAGSAATVTIPASRVTWGVTIMKAAPNRDNALAFLLILLSDEGAAILNAAGPAAISPPLVSKQDFARLPSSLKAVVRQK